MLDTSDPAQVRQLHNGSTTTDLSLEQAISQYIGSNPDALGSFEGLFPYLENLGFQVERPTRSGGQLSGDKLVNSRTGELYDLIGSSTDPSQAHWTTNISPLAGEYWWEGQRQVTPRPGSGLEATAASGDPLKRTGVEATDPLGGLGALGALTGSSYAAAYAARARQRRLAASAGGRQSTIGAGFGAGRPRTAPRTLGGY